MPCSFSISDRSSTPEAVGSVEDRRFGGGGTVAVMNGKDGRVQREKKDLVGECSSSSSSSIGKNSDEVAADGGCEEEEEVTSPLRRRAKSDRSFSNLEALQESLPVRNGISIFYNGKSKSFASLADATTATSIKDIAKPENAYSRRKRSLLAYALLYENSDNVFQRRAATTSLLKSPQGGGISKRPSINSARSTLALAVAMQQGSASNTVDSSIIHSASNGEPAMPTFRPPQLSAGGRNAVVSPSPLIRRNMHPWRSFSVMDLQHCAAAGAGTGGAPLTCGVNCLSPSSISDRNNSDQVS